MGAYRFIRLQLADAVACITLARPDRLNALTPAVFAELTAALDEALGQGARAIVLTGEGRFFSAGADIQPDGAGYEGLPEDLGALLQDHYHPFVRKLAGLEVPVVTAINGPCAGAGVSLALAGDIVVMAQSAYLLLAFVNIGLVPDAGATWLVARSIGRARALEMALLGEKMAADQAKQAGLITRVAPDGEVMEQAMALAQKLAEGPALALGAIRQQVAFALSHDLDATLDEERRNQQICGFTQDFAEAIAAFGEKRKPVFTGQ